MTSETLALSHMLTIRSRAGSRQSTSHHSRCHFIYVSPIVDLCLQIASWRLAPLFKGHQYFKHWIILHSFHLAHYRRTDVSLLCPYSVTVQTFLLARWEVIENINITLSLIVLNWLVLACFIARNCICLFS